MSILNENYFKMSNAIFHYGLLPNQLAVYCYLVCTTGQKEYCWPGSSRTAYPSQRACGPFLAHSVAPRLRLRPAALGSQAIGETIRGGRWRQSNNHYYILDLPPLPRRSA